MNKSIYLLLTVLFLHQGNFLLAQKEAYNWYFGYRAGITFNPDGKNPKALLDANINFNQLEGVATISDKEGKLLFYTDGMSILSRNHFPMPNGEGLDGNSSSTQSAIIVPMPDNPFIYYVFTVPHVGGGQGLRYTIVDMRLNGGLGDVKSQADKNRFLYGPVAEKITAVRHKNGIDIWIIAHGWNSNEFRSYLLTSDGIKSPHISTFIGTRHEGDKFNNIGYMKTSLDGKKIALTICLMNIVEIFDFDNSTGYLSNVKTIKMDDFQQLYGLEFSPDGSLLYVGESFHSFCSIYQFNLNAGSTSAIINSRTTIAWGKFFGALQLGPDSKIYIAANDELFLEVIHSPNELGSGCQYQEKAVDLKGRYSALGLPNFLPGLIVAIYITGNYPLCEGETLRLESNSSKPVVNAKFEWTGPKGFKSDSQVVIIKNVKKEMEGFYRLKVIQPEGIAYDSVFVNIYPKPDVKILPGDTIYLCKGDSLLVTSSIVDPKFKLQWSTGATSPRIYVKDEGKVFLIAANSNNCSDTAWTEVIHVNAPDASIDILGKTEFCEGDSTILSLGNVRPDDIINWSTGESEAQIVVRSEGIYIAEVKSVSGCIDYDSVFIKVYDLPQAKIITEGSTSFCMGDSIILTAYPQGDEYFHVWSTGEESGGITVKTSQKIYLTVFNEENCFSKDSIETFVYQPPKVELNHKNNTRICYGDTLHLTTTKPFVNYKWSNNETSREIIVSDSGRYTVEVTDENGCKNSAEIYVDIVKINYDLPEKLVFTTYLSDSEAEKTFQIRNSNKFELYISSISVENNPSTFVIETLPELPALIAQDSSMEIKIRFDGVMDTDINDNLLIKFDEPCKLNGSIPIIVKNAGTIISLSDTSGNTGERNFRIPLKAKFKNDVSSVLSYKARIEFDASLFLPDENHSSYITDGNGSMLRHISLSGDNVTVTNNEIELTSIKGMLLLPKEDKMPLKIAHFEWDNKYIPIDSIHGSIEIKNLCRRPLARIKLIDIPIVKLTPNPADGETEISIECELNGMMEISIFNLHGEKMITEIINKKDRIEIKNLDIHTLSPGIYGVVVKSERDIIHKPLIIVR